MDEGLAAIAGAVGTTLGGSGWRVTPLPGSSGRTFLATGPGRVVVRFADAPAVLDHLGRTGLAPRVLGSGEIHGRSFVLQEALEGHPADGAWIRANRLEVARLLGRVASDTALAGMAQPLTPGRFVDELVAAPRPAERLGASRIIEELRVRAEELERVPVVASHGDPNASNLMVCRDGLRLIDWDDLRRADPLRDLGQVAWWYLAEADWPSFMDAAGTTWDASSARRLAWWVAAESIDVATRLWPAHPQAAAAFARDAEAALAGRPNPRRE